MKPVCPYCHIEVDGRSPGFDQGSYYWCERCGALEDDGTWRRPELVAELALVLREVEDGGENAHCPSCQRYGHDPDCALEAVLRKAGA